VQVTADTSGFAAPPGTPASITVKVFCTVDLSDIGVAGLPGSRTLTEFRELSLRSTQFAA
jgi:hypothetical protein